MLRETVTARTFCPKRSDGLGNALELRAVRPRTERGEVRGLTPRLFWSLLDRRRIVDAREDLRAGVIASTIIIMTPRKNARTVKPEDSFPSLQVLEPVEEVSEFAADHCFGIS